MTYSNKVKAGRVIVERMDSLEQDGKFTFKYINSHATQYMRMVRGI